MIAAEISVHKPKRSRFQNILDILSSCNALHFCFTLPPGVVDLVISAADIHVCRWPGRARATRTPLFDRGRYIDVLQYKNKFCIQR